MITFIFKGTVRRFYRGGGSSEPLTAQKYDLLKWCHGFVKIVPILATIKSTVAAIEIEKFKNAFSKPYS